MTHIPGTASAEESVLLTQLADIRKAQGNDGDDPAQAANNALDRLAKARATGGVTVAAAYDDVLKTDQGAALYSITKGVTQITDPAAALAAIRKIAAT